MPSSSTAAAASIDAAPATPVIRPPWVIADIKVEGVKNIKTSVVRSQIKARKGDLYDRPDLDRDVQNLLGLGSFERVAADINPAEQRIPEHYRAVAGSSTTIVLIFMVQEKPLVRKVLFSGNSQLSKASLSDVATLKPKDPLDSVKWHEDEQKVLEKYREKGFLDASVQAQVSLDTATLQADVIYKIIEGRKSRIELVTIDGIKSFKPRKILKLLEKNRRKKVFVEKALKTDIKKVEDFYLNHGFLDVSISSPIVTLSSDSTKIYIKLALEEGEAYRFGDSSFSGNTVCASTQLVKAIEYRRGKIFSQEKYEETIRGIQEQYADKGRLKARVAPVKTFNSTTSLMDVDYAISEGNIIYIDHVDVDGNKATKTYVLRREVTVKPGDAFSASRIRRSREKILNLGFIDDVDVDIQGTPDPDRVDVTFDVTEGKPGMLTAGAAYSSVDGFIGTLSMSHLNLFGRAQQSKVEWQFGKRVQNYSLSWRTPWVGDKPMSLGLDVFNTRRIMPFQTSVSAYVNKNQGASISLGPRFEDDTYLLNFSYTFSRITIADIQNEFLGPLQPGTSDYSSLSVSFARDTRDSIWDPTRGSRHALGLQLAGGPLSGDINFFSPTLVDAWHFHLFSVGDYPLVFTAANRTSYITQFGKTTEVPVNNRFFLGGQDTLRGYTVTGQVGFPSGGKVMDVLNLEFGFPLARERRKTIVKIVGFFDIGTAWDNPRSMTLRIGSRPQDLKTDAGIGIRFTTPAFPIRLDWGYGFNHIPGERKYQINFGLGNLF